MPLNYLISLMAGLRWLEEIAAEGQLIWQAEKIFNLVLSRRAARPAPTLRIFQRSPYLLKYLHDRSKIQGTLLPQETVIILCRIICCLPFLSSPESPLGTGSRRFESACPDHPDRLNPRIIPSRRSSRALLPRRRRRFLELAQGLGEFHQDAQALAALFAPHAPEQGDGTRRPGLL